MAARKSRRWWLLFSFVSSIVGVIWLLERRWNQWFTITHSEKSSVQGSDGRVYLGQRVTIQSVLACPPDLAWDYACTSGLMQHVSWPLLRMEAVDRELPKEWFEGDRIKVRLSTFGIIPLGEHNIYIQTVNKEQGEIRSLEHGRLIRALDHRILVLPYGRNLTLYTDDVCVSAGLLTPLLAWGVRFFYRYRQTRWQWMARQFEQGSSD